MEIVFLTADATNQALLKLMASHDELHWAVAWGSFASHGEALLRHKSKFRNVIFGISFCQTDPDLVDALVGVKHARVATKFPKGTFHPKIYCFRTGQEVAAIIGSANFTSGGLGNNLEAAVLVTGNAGDQAFRALFKFVRESARYGEPVTKDFADAYRVRHKRAKRLEKPPRNPVPSSNRRSIKQATSELVGMTWQEYVRQVRSSAHHDVDESLRLLRIAQQWFASTPSFANLSTPRRKAIAGIIGDYQRFDAELEREWGWFGSMRGMGDFANRIDKGDMFMARAIDSIPRQGPVTEGEYESFVEDFLRAFEKSDRTGGVATASRLLALKRPDTFLCVCGPNKEKASEAMGFARSTLKLSNYWEQIVETVRLSDWYNSARPSVRNAELWDCRVAMLDAIYYRPKPPRQRH